jgi:hypothetical protein
MLTKILAVEKLGVSSLEAFGIYSGGIVNPLLSKKLL